ncbi:MAG: DUF6512 family protein [Candidatus Saccharibacteria bacterium]|nr:DUF6512 family protein [Candidatus Saccharibacteria bacterium]
MLEIIGTIFIITAGTLSHFLYDWTKHNKIIGFFAAVNESTWEHLKLVIAPTFVWMIVELHFYSGNPGYIFARFISLLAMLLIIPLIFYAYTHFAKKSILVIDIGSFFVAIILGQLLFSWLISLGVSNLVLTHIGIIGMILIFFAFIMDTYVPQKDFLHKDPITHKYGIHGHSDRKPKVPKK